MAGKLGHALEGLLTGPDAADLAYVHLHPMPTAPARRPIALLTLSGGLVDQCRLSAGFRSTDERDDPALGFAHERSELRNLRDELEPMPSVTWLTASWACERTSCRRRLLVCRGGSSGRVPRDPGRRRFDSVGARNPATVLWTSLAQKVDGGDELEVSDALCTGLVLRWDDDDPNRCLMRLMRVM